MSGSGFSQHTGYNLLCQAEGTVDRPQSLTESTAAPRISPSRSLASAVFASSKRKASTSVRTGTRGARAMNSTPSARVRLATERSTRSSQRIEYGKLGMSLMWMPAQTTTPPGPTARKAEDAPRAARAQRRGHKFAGRGEDDGRVERLRGGAKRVAGPLGAEASREILRARVGRSGEGEYTAVVIARHLGHDVG